MGIKAAPVINDPYQLLLQRTSLWFSRGEGNREYQAERGFTSPCQGQPRRVLLGQGWAHVYMGKNKQESKPGLI